MNVARFRSFAAAAAVLIVLASSAVAHPGHGEKNIVHNHEGGQIAGNLLWVAGITAAAALIAGAVLAWRAYGRSSKKLSPVRIRRD
jgi:hypothetical protein